MTAQTLTDNPSRDKVKLFSGVPRLALVLLALLVAGYGLHGVLTDDLFLPAKRGPGNHYQGLSAMLMSGMMLSFAGCVIALAFSEIDPVRRRLARPLLPSCLFIATFVFMIAGLTVHASPP